MDQETCEEIRSDIENIVYYKQRYDAALLLMPEKIPADRDQAMASMRLLCRARQNLMGLKVFLAHYTSKRKRGKEMDDLARQALEDKEKLI